jgi:hypothetical protein
MTILATRHDELWRASTCIRKITVTIHQVILKINLFEINIIHTRRTMDRDSAKNMDKGAAAYVDVCYIPNS